MVAVKVMYASASGPYRLAKAVVTCPPTCGSSGPAYSWADASIPKLRKVPTKPHTSSVIQRSLPSPQLMPTGATPAVTLKKYEILPASHPQQNASNESEVVGEWRVNRDLGR